MYIGRSKKFDKQYKKLPKKIQQQFDSRLSLYLEAESNPLLKVHNLSGEYRGHQSFNVNTDVRAVFTRVPEKLYFVAIGSHSELYE
jgi:mRNA-degrading endonuclease YafQ of YafQ-DinJ toxin-antitoxin module